MVRYSVVYNNDGRRKSILRNGTAPTYNFNDGLHLSSFSQAFNAGSAVNNLTNSFTSYNPANQIITRNYNNSLYYYQGNENRTGVYVPDNLNRYTTVAGQSLLYLDGNSNLTNDGAVTYTYDDENRLLTSSLGGASFVYDPLGRLFQSTINGTATQFLYDGDALVSEFNASNSVQRRYVHGDQVDEPWVQYNGASVGSAYRRYLLADHQGSIIAHADGSGNALNSLAYDNFGIPATKNIDRFGYTAQIWFKELGLFHYKARMYSPKLGRFLQTDPIGYKDNMNMYAYTGNDPLNMNDSSGQFAFPVHGLITFFAALNSGHGWSSFGIALQSMTRDLGTQGPSKADVAVHSMRAVNQSLTEARSNSQSVIKTELAAGRLGNAAHTIQDAHENYKEWDGTYGGVRNFFAHVLSDLFPSAERVGVRIETRETLLVVLVMRLQIQRTILVVLAAQMDHITVIME